MSDSHDWGSPNDARSEPSGSPIASRALAWWEDRRPVGWNVNDHLENPTVNCLSGTEQALALAVADYVRADGKR